MSVLTVNDASKINMTTFHPATTYINERMNNLYIHTCRLHNADRLSRATMSRGVRVPRVTTSRGLNALGYN